jgi:hypothetical protein
MIDQHSSISTDQFDEDLYANFQTAERVLNTAIVQADISESFEEYLDIFNRYYSDDIEVSSDTGEGSIRGKERVRSLVLNFLVPLHVMAEVGGLSISIRESPIPGDTAAETHSAWTLELVGVSGKTCILSWRAFRKWNGARVVYEHHYDQQQTGGPLTSDDLNLNVADPNDGFRKPSKAHPDSSVLPKKGIS